MASSFATAAGRSLLRAVLGRISIGTLEVRWSDDTEEVFEGEPGDRARLEVRDEAMLSRALVDDGAVGLGASFIEGAWDSPDLAGFLELAARNNFCASSV